MTLTVQRYFLPTLVEGIAIKQLAALGFKDPSLTVGDIGLTRGSFSDIRLAEGVHAADLHITYSPLSLVSGKVHEVVLGSLRLRATHADGAFVIEGLPSFEKGADWPFRSVRLQSAGLVITDASGGTSELSFSGGMTVSESGLSLQTDAVVGGRTIKVEADFSMDEPGLLRVRTARLSLLPTSYPDAIAAWPQVRAGTVTLRNATLETDEAGGWKGDCPEVVFDVETRAWEYHGVELPALKGHIPLALSGDGRSIRVRLTDRTGVALSQVRASVAGRSLVIAGDVLAISPLEREPLLSVELPGEGRFTAKLAMSLNLQGGVKAKWGEDLDVTTAESGVQVTADISEVGTENITGRITLSGAGVKHTEFEASDISATVPFVLVGPSSPDPGRVKIERVSFRGKPLGTMDLTCLVSRDGIQATGKWDVAESVKANVEASFGGGVGRMAMDLAETDLEKLLPVMDAFVSMEGVSLAGRLDAKASVELEAGRLSQQLDLSLSDALYAEPESQMRIAGITGAIRFDSIWPPHTPGNQRLRVGRYEQGKVVLTDGDLRFSVQDDQQLNIERMDWTFGSGGRVTAHAIHFDRRNPSLDTELFVEDLNLEDWLTVLTNEKLTASGKLYGRVPFKARATPDGYKVAFGKGFLYNAPGMGSIQMKDATTVSELLARADPRFTQDPELRAVRERLSTALTDFEYSVFRFNLIPQPDGDTTLQMFTQGKGRGPGGQEVGGLTVNFNNFQLATNIALFGQSVFGKGVNRRLEEFFNPIEQKTPQEVQP